MLYLYYCFQIQNQLPLGPSETGFFWGGFFAVVFFNYYYLKTNITKKCNCKEINYGLLAQCCVFCTFVSQNLYFPTKNY